MTKAEYESKPPGSKPPEPATDLRRDLTLLDAVAIGFGAIIGAGIFVVTGVAAGFAGPAFLVGLFIAAIAATANALSSAQLAAEYPRSGGTYEYGYEVLGPWPGFIAGWLFLASKLAAAGTVAIGLAGYLEALIPGVPPRAMAVGAIVLFTALNYFGVRRSSTVNVAIVAVSLSSLLLFVAMGAGSFRTENLQPFAPAGWRGTLQAAAILFFAYTGYARIATLAEEVRDPRRTIPRAIVITIGGAVLLYGAVALTAAGSIGAAAMAATDAPLHAAAMRLPSTWVATAVAVGAVTAMLGVILSQLLGLSRMAFAMARRSDLPDLLAHVDPRTGVPSRAVVVIGAIAAIIAATGTLGEVAAAAAFTILIYYAITNVAALRMPRESRLYHPAIAAVGLVSCIALAISLDWGTIATGTIVLAAGVVGRVAARRAH